MERIKIGDIVVPKVSAIKDKRCKVIGFNANTALPVAVDFNGVIWDFKTQELEVQ